jgi:hypothetical protein
MLTWLYNTQNTNLYRGHEVAHLVVALRYKPEDSIPRWCHWNLSGRIMILGLTQSLTEMSARNISWVVKAAGA